MKKIVCTGLAIGVVIMSGCGGGGSGSSEESTTVIDVMGLYSPNANAAGDAETRIQHYIAVTNEISKASNINIKYRLVHTEQYGNDVGTSSDTLDVIQADPYVLQLRERYKADEVVMYQPYASTNDGFCGVAYFNEMLQREAAYAHVTIDCPADTTAHEIGHGLGLGHSHIQGDEGIFPYSVGHGVNGEFSTVMAYPEFFYTDHIEMVYSNPALDCKGFPCGVEIGTPGEADAAESIRQTMKAVSEFY